MAATVTPKLEIKLGLDKLGLDKAIKGIVKDLGTLDKRASRTQSTFSKLSGALTGVFKQGIGVAAGLGMFRLVQKLGGAFRDLLNSSLDFEEQMRNINSVAQLGDKAFGQLTQSVLTMAEDPRITDMPAKLAEGLYTLASSGYSTADSMTILKAAAIGATAGLSTTDVATDVLASTLGAYGLTAADATKTMNDLFQIVFVSKFTFNDLAASLATVTPAAAALGVSITEVGAAMATMGKQGTDAQTATVQLNGIMTGLLKPTDAMTQFLQSLGYESGSAAIQALGFSKVLMLLQEAIGGDSTKAAALFGDVRALRGILQLTTQDGALYNDNLEAMGHAQDGAGATAKALKEQMKSARFQLRLLHKNIVLFFTEGIGLGAAKKFAAFIAMFNRFFTRMFKLRHEFNSLKAFLLSFHTLLHQLFGRRVGDAFFEALREGIRIFRFFRDVVNGDWAKAWAQLRRIGRDGQRFLNWLWSSIKDIFNSINWKKVGDTIWTGLKIAFAFLTTTAPNWLWPKIKKFAVDTWDKIPWGTIGDKLWAGIQVAYNYTTKTALPWISDQTTQLFSDAFGAVDWGAVGSALWTGLKTALDFVLHRPEMFAIGPAVAGFIAFGPIGAVIIGGLSAYLIANRDKIWDFLKTADWGAVGMLILNGLISAFMYAFNAISTWISNNPKLIAYALIFLIAEVPFYIGKALGWLAVNIIAFLVKELVKHPKEVAAAIAAIFLVLALLPEIITVAIWAVVIAIVTFFILGIAESIKEWGDKHIQPALTDMINSMIGWVQRFDVSGLWNAAVSWGESLIGGLIQGIVNKWNDFVGKIQDVLNEFNKIPSFLRKGSPSKLMMENGKSAVQGLSIGIDKAMPMLEKSVGKMMSTLGTRPNGMAAATPAIAKATHAVNQSVQNNRGGNVFHVTIHSNDGKQVAREMLRYLDLVESGQRP